MEANELRMFNAIKRFGQIVYVNEHTFEDVKINNGSYSPIELTEDWLLKMGFDQLESGTYICTNQIVLRKDIKGYLYEVFKGKETLIKHVHQLQNLYFALTNTELTINL